MKMLETMLSAGGGAVVEQPASQFGLDADQAPSSVSALLPALAGDLQRNAGSDGFGISSHHQREILQVCRESFPFGRPGRARAGHVPSKQNLWLRRSDQGGVHSSGKNGGERHDYQQYAPD